MTRIIINERRPDYARQTQQHCRARGCFTAAGCGLARRVGCAARHYFAAVQVPVRRPAHDPRPAAGGHGLRELRGVERYHAPLCPARREGHRARGQLRRRAEAPLRLRHRRHRHPAQLAPILAVGDKRREPRRSPARLAAGVQRRGRLALQPAARRGARPRRDVFRCAPARYSRYH